MTLAERLQAAIARRKMSQTEVADAVGISKQQFGLIVSGKNPNPGILLVERIAEAIGISVAELYAEDGTNTPN